MAWGAPKLGAVATPVASGDYTLAEPAGIAAGDLMVACFALRSNVGFDTPGDWNLVEAELSGDTDATNGIASAQMFWCVRGGSAPTLTFTRTGGNVAQGCIVAYAGGHATTPFDVSDSATAPATATTVVVTGISTAEAGELIVAVSGAGDTLVATSCNATNPGVFGGSDQVSAPQNNTWFHRIGQSTGTGADTGINIFDAVRATAGATGDVTITYGTGARHAGIVAAFKLAAVGGGGAVISPYYSSYYSRMIQEGSQF
jgi:hypothetical protein